MAVIISKEYYSNCLIEAVKAKLKNWNNVTVTYIPAKYSNNKPKCCHICWSDGKADYDFGVNKEIKWYQLLWHKGYIRQRPLGWNEKYKFNKEKGCVKNE